MSIGLSIVVPLLNEREALPELVDEIAAACAGLDRWEVILVDDGSTDGSWGTIASLATTRSEVRGLRLRRNFGKSAALATGIEAARGEAIVTMDGDGQDDPAEIPALLAELGRGYDLVSGWKRDRKDSARRRVASRFFNFVTSRITGVRIHDFNCGLKAYRGGCARSLDIYGELHRFVAVLAAQEGWRVGELPVRHRPRLHGSSHFGLERFARGFLDLIAVGFMGRYRNRPLHLFGGLGLVSVFIGSGICLYLTVDKLSGASIGGRPLLFLGVLLIVVGVQLGSLGLLGQMVAVTQRQASDGRAEAAHVAEVTRSALSGRGDSGQATTETSSPD